jgi:hypothetical protein
MSWHFKVGATRNPREPGLDFHASRDDHVGLGTSCLHVKGACSSLYCPYRHRHSHSHISLLKLLHTTWTGLVVFSNHRHDDGRVAAQPSRCKPVFNLAWLSCSTMPVCAHVSRSHKDSQPGHDSCSGHNAPSIAAKSKSSGHGQSPGQERRMAELILASQQTSNQARHVLHAAYFLGINLEDTSPTFSC